MPNCIERFAQAWQFKTFFCAESLLVGIDGGTGNSDHLTDTGVDFLDEGIKANVGMVLYNLTDGSSGPVTAVTETTIHATLTGGTDNDWDVGDSYRIVPLTRNEIGQINNFLDIAAADIHAALAASGACDCTLASWAATLLVKLNIIEASAFYRCPCNTTLTDEVRQSYLEWATNQLELVRKGQLELCSGATGSEFPAIDFAEQAITEWNAAQIIFNDRDAE